MGGDPLVVRQKIHYVLGQDLAREPVCAACARTAYSVSIKLVDPSVETIQTIKTQVKIDLDRTVRR